MAPVAKWSEEKIRAEAAKYSTRMGFSRGCCAAYRAAVQRFPGLVQNIFPTKVSNLKWTEERLRAEAVGCSTKVEFKRKLGNGATKAANAIGLLSELFGEDKRVWLSDEEVLAIGNQYATAQDFKRNDYGAYQVAARRGLRSQFNFQPQQESWTEEKIRKVASKYSTYSDFLEQNIAAYRAASFHGILHDLGLVTRTGRYAGTADIVYVWRAVGETHLGVPLYKIGITSSRQGDERIKRVAREGGMNFDVIFFENVGVGNAYRVERLLHKIGTDPKLEGFSGCTEFRALTATQLETVLDILVSNVCS